MKITRVINNNTVATSANNKEIILTGAGIGFQKKPGESVEIEKIEKVYQIRDSFFRKYEQIYKHIEPVCFKAAENIRAYAEKKLEITLSPQFVFSLADHISFAIDRQKRKEQMPNLMLQEIRLLYGKEYEVGKYGREVVQRMTGIFLPVDEEGYIALHIVNSKIGEVPVDVNNILILTNGILKILQEDLNILFREDDFEYNRFLMHLKFLARRIFLQEQNFLSVVGGIYPELIEKEPKLGETLDKIKNYIWRTFDYEITDEEATYLAVHIIRIKEKQDCYYN